MEKKVITGTLQLSTGVSEVFQEIDPPDLKGYGHRVVDISLAISGADTANTGMNVLVGASVKTPARSTYSLSGEGLAADLIGLFSVPFQTASPLVVGSLAAENTYVPDPGETIFLDRLNLFLKAFAVPNGSIVVNYAVQIEPVKMTSALQARLLEKIYS